MKTHCAAVPVAGERTGPLRLKTSNIAARLGPRRALAPPSVAAHALPKPRKYFVSQRLTAVGSDFVRHAGPCRPSENGALGSNLDRSVAVCASSLPGIGVHIGTPFPAECSGTYAGTAMPRPGHCEPIVVVVAVVVVRPRPQPVFGGSAQRIHHPPRRRHGPGRGHPSPQRRRTALTKTSGIYFAYIENIFRFL